MSNVTNIRYVSTIGISKANYFADFITVQLEVTMPTLAKDKKYYAKDLIGADVWELLEKDEKLTVGVEMADMVKHKLLPLACAGKNSQNWLCYWLM